jgi:hypothetical protein
MRRYAVRKEPSMQTLVHPAARLRSSQISARLLKVNSGGDLCAMQ